MNLFQILDGVTCKDIAFLINLVKIGLNIIRFAIPLIIIILTSIEFFKVIAGGDEKAQKEAQNKALKRLLYALVIFLIPTIVDVVFRIIPTLVKGTKDDGEYNAATVFFKCYDNPDSNINIIDGKTALNWQDGNLNG